jgi:hypothetical protein
MAPYAASVEDSRRKLQFDLYYIKHMSFFLDVYIFIKTLKTILFGRERSRQPKPPNSDQQPPHAEIKTETLFLDPANGAYSKTSPTETDERRRTERIG